MLDFVKSKLMCKYNTDECDEALETSARRLKEAINNNNVTNYKCDSEDSLEQLKHLQTWMAVNDYGFVLYITATEGIEVDKVDQAQGMKMVDHPVLRDHRRVIEMRATNERKVTDYFPLYIEQYSSLTDNNTYRVDGYRLTHDEEMRDAFLDGMSYWICEECDKGVNCITLPCPRCNMELQKIPIYDNEIDYMRQTMKEAHSNRKHKTGESNYPWYCRDCYIVVDDTTVSCSGCNRQLNARDAETYRKHEKPELDKVLEHIGNLSNHETTRPNTNTMKRPTSEGNKVS
jgi:hypothetical protein